MVFRALVEHLSKYLAMRIALDISSKKVSSVDTVIASTSSGAGGTSVKDLTIYIANSNGGALCPLSTSTSLLQVNETHWKQNKPMELFYAFKRQ